MRGDKSFAYDLIVPPGRVSSRVALLLRSTERKPARTRFVRLHSPIKYFDLINVSKGELKGSEDIQLSKAWVSLFL